jgi:hypothetical protein
VKFSEANIQTFYRLKLQSIENRIDKQNDENLENSEEVKEKDMPAVEQRLFKIEQQIVNLDSTSKFQLQN